MIHNYTTKVYNEVIFCTNVQKKACLCTSIIRWNRCEKSREFSRRFENSWDGLYNPVKIWNWGSGILGRSLKRKNFLIDYCIHFHILDCKNPYCYNYKCIAILFEHDCFRDHRNWHEPHHLTSGCICFMKKMNHLNN